MTTFDTFPIAQAINRIAMITEPHTSTSPDRGQLP
jgi:hypothetical protein